MTRLYGTNEWQEDLKNILGRAVSSLDQHVVFLFNDSEVNCIYLFYLLRQKFIKIVITVLSY